MHFSQHTCKDTFSCGRPLLQTLQEFLNLEKSIHDQEFYLDVVDLNGTLFSLDNRRFVFFIIFLTHQLQLFKLWVKFENISPGCGVCALWRRCRTARICSLGCASTREVNFLATTGKSSPPRTGAPRSVFGPASVSLFRWLGLALSMFGSACPFASLNMVRDSFVPNSLHAPLEQTREVLGKSLASRFFCHAVCCGLKFKWAKMKCGRSASCFHLSVLRLASNAMQLFDHLVSQPVA